MALADPIPSSGPTGLGGIKSRPSPVPTSLLGARRMSDLGYWEGPTPPPPTLSVTREAWTPGSGRFYAWVVTPA